MVGSFREADLLKQLPCATLRVSGRSTSEKCWQLDVFLGRQLLHEVVRLEDEADFVAAKLCECALRKLIDSPSG